MFKKLASAFKTTPLVLALLLTFGLSYAYAAWSEPTATPPGGNVAAPINTGSAAQTKTGSLGVGSANAPAHTLEVNGAVSLNGYYSGEPNSSGGLILNHSTGVSGKEASIEYYGSGRSIIGPDGNEQSIAFRFINDNDGIGFVNNTVSRNISLYGYINSVPVTPLTFDSSGNTTVNGKATASDFCTTSGKCLSAAASSNSLPSGTLCGSATYLTANSTWYPGAPCEGYTLPSCPSGFYLSQTGPNLVGSVGQGDSGAFVASCVKS